MGRCEDDLGIPVLLYSMIYSKEISNQCKRPGSPSVQSVS